MLISRTRSTKVGSPTTSEERGSSRRRFRCMLKWSSLGFGECLHLPASVTGLNSVTRDTVASVGIGAPVLPFNASETFVRTFRHALAIDERRAKFQPNPWKYQKPCECAREDQDDDGNTVTELPSLHANCGQQKNSTCWCKDDKRYHGGVKTDVLEVWFPGFHAGM